MPRIIRRTKTVTRTVTPDGVIEETPVIHEEVTETDAVDMLGADAVSLPVRRTVISQAAPPVVEESVAPVVRRVVRQPAPEIIEEIIEQPAPVVRRVVRQPAAGQVVEEIIEQPGARQVVEEIIEQPAVRRVVRQPGAEVVEEIIEQPAVRVARG